MSIRTTQRAENGQTSGSGNNFMRMAVASVLLIFSIWGIQSCRSDIEERRQADEIRATYFLPFFRGDLPLSIAEQGTGFRSMKVQRGPKNSLIFHFHIVGTEPVPLEYILNGDITRVYREVPWQPSPQLPHDGADAIYIAWRITPGSVDPSGRPITQATLHWWADENPNPEADEGALRPR